MDLFVLEIDINAYRFMYLMVWILFFLILCVMLMIFFMFWGLASYSSTIL